MRKQNKVNLPQTINIECLEMTEFDFTKARGKKWVRYQEGPFPEAMYPELHNDDLLLVDFDDKDLGESQKGYLFLLCFPKREKGPLIVRKVSEYYPGTIQISQVHYGSVHLIDLSKKPNPILGRVLYSIRNWAKDD